MLSEIIPDLVLTDVAMPAKDGYTVMSAVSALEATLGHHVPVVAVTANAHAEDRERAIAAGFDEYLAKPIQPSALARAVVSLAAVRDRR